MLAFDTERLRVRPWTPEDAEDAFRIYGDPEVARWLSGEPVASLAAMRQRLDDRRASDQELMSRGYGGWALELRATARVVGAVILKPLPPELSDIEIGWHVARDCWGNGYAVEGIRPLIDHAFLVLGLERLHAVLYPDNLRSRRVCEKLGMEDLGMTDAYYGKNLAHYGLERPR